MREASLYWMSLFSFLFQVRYSRKSSSAVLLWWEKAAMIVTAQVVVVYLNLMIGDSRSHQLNSPRISSESMPEYPIDSHSLAVAATYKKGESHPIYAWNQSVSYISSDDYLIPACDLVLQSSITHQTRVSLLLPAGCWRLQHEQEQDQLDGCSCELFSCSSIYSI